MVCQYSFGSLYLVHMFQSQPILLIYVSNCLPVTKTEYVTGRLCVALQVIGHYYTEQGAFMSSFSQVSLNRQKIVHNNVTRVHVCSCTLYRGLWRAALATGASLKPVPAILAALQYENRSQHHLLLQMSLPPRAGTQCLASCTPFLRD